MMALLPCLYDCGIQQLLICVFIRLKNLGELVECNKPATNTHLLAGKLSYVAVSIHSCV